MSLIHNIAKKILKKRVDLIPLPQFSEGEVVRKRIVFSGKVQRVGFRDEVELIAKRIGLTGNVKNSKGNVVITEAQGTKEMIKALIDAVMQEKRFIIKDMQIENLDVVTTENKFKLV